MRLDKYLSTVTDLSRMQSKKAIKAGMVRVSGEKIFDPRITISPLTRVEFDGDLLRSATYRYFMMNKPTGCVSSTKDRQHITAIDLMDEDNLEHLHIAGRLDIDTTGLLLITDDGQWSHRIMSPNKGCNKTYYVETVREINTQLISEFKQGIKLDNEIRLTRPAELILTESHLAELTISEGKYHQVKRMFAAVGNKVAYLHRHQIGDICLDEKLMPGEYRSLTTEEIASV